MSEIVWHQCIFSRRTNLFQLRDWRELRVRLERCGSHSSSSSSSSRRSSSTAILTEALSSAITPHGHSAPIWMAVDYM